MPLLLLLLLMRTLRRLNWRCCNDVEVAAEEEEEDVEGVDEDVMKGAVDVVDEDDVERVTEIGD